MNVSTRRNLRSTASFHSPASRAKLSHSTVEERTTISNDYLSTESGQLQGMDWYFGNLRLKMLERIHHSRVPAA